MTKHFFITLFFIAFIFGAFGQSFNNKVYQKFITADSIILVSHLTTYTAISDEKTNEKIGSYRLVKKNEINYNIVKEHYQLSKKDIDSVAKIIITTNTDSIIKDIQCFMPHHGIVIFKKGKCSYFDICFGCRHFITSKDIKISEELDDKTWNDLESFFRNRNLNYELTENNSEIKNNN